MIGRSRHLNDDRLVECYFAGHTGDSLEPGVADHLAGCPDCQARALELTNFLNGVRADGDAAADEVFTLERLRQQHDQILRRIEHMHHPARVLSFPSRVTRRISSGARRVTPRWLAAAAAAGLFVGAVGGRLIPGTQHGLPGVHFGGNRVTPPRATPAPASLTTVPVISIEPDDADFLKQIELALERTHPRELQPFDALTPHVREVVSEARSLPEHVFTYLP